jgi:GR25 family glycosyltransferase involved in LPS biosynthesis
MSESLPPVFIMCNPEKESIRYKFLLEHLPKHGIPLEKIHFVHAEWGTELSSERVFNAYDPFKHRYGLKMALCFKANCLTHGELSLLLTFRKVLEKAWDSGANEVIVFESDVCLRDDFLERFTTVMKDAAEKPWDYISLGEGSFLRPKAAAQGSYFSESKLYPSEGQFVFRCCDSMVFRRSFIGKLLQTYMSSPETPIRECLDWELNVQILAHRGVSLWVDPPLVEPGSGRWKVPTTLPA